MVLRPWAWAGYLFVVPALSIIGVFFLVPVCALFLLSLTDFDIYGLADIDNVRLVGLQNYQKLLANPLFWQALWNTCYFALVGGPLGVCVSLAAALAIQSRLAWFPDALRTIFFAPVVTTVVAVAVVWQFLYDTRFGLINQGLGWLGIEPLDWLGDPRLAMPSIILMATWKNFGYNMVIFVAGLGAIPGQLYDAARIDGAGPWQRFVRITLPMLAPTFLFVGVTTTIGYLQLFAEPYVMTRGGPLHSTYSVILLMYEEGFRWWNLGMASAIAIVFSLIMFVATSLQIWGQSRWQL